MNMLRLRASSVGSYITPSFCLNLLLLFTNRDLARFPLVWLPACQGTSIQICDKKGHREVF
jgi:hypothetical protein